MKKEGNFSKAVNELLGGNLRSGERREAAATLGTLVTVPGGGVGEEAEAPSSSEGYRSSSSARPGGESMITQDMVIRGSVSSASNILMEGSIVGDVNCEGDIAVKGKIEGKVHARSVSIQGGAVQGDIETSGSIFVGEESTINGNIKGGRIDVNGSVTGNLASSDRVTLNPKAVVEGDIVAIGLSMADGAQLKGSVDVHRPA